MNIDPQTIIGELVAEDYRTATVFKNNGIDFCCNGNRTIGEACEKKHIAIETLLESLNKVMVSGNDSVADYNAWPLDLLSDYIEKKHHRYVRAKIKEIVPFLNKVARVHGDNHPELKEVEQLFNDSASELSHHMQKEEMILFPFIRKMLSGEQASATPPFDTVQNPIEMMKNEHENEGERFRRIAALTNNYIPPVDACNTYKVSFSILKEFEEDLHLHIHLENNILFPKAIAMEQEIMGV